MKKILLISGLVLCALLVTSCREKTSHHEKSNRLSIFVSVGPQAYTVQNITGDLADIHVLVGPGSEPHTFEPTPKQLAVLSESKIYFCIGVPFEKQLVKKLSDYKELQIINVSPRSDMIHMEYIHGKYVHNEDLDPHTWMSVRLMKKQANIVAQELSRIDPTNEKVYQSNLKKLHTRLDNLSDELSVAMESIKGKTFYVFHPAFGYFAREYGLVQEAVETGGKSPSLKHVNNLIEKAKTEGVKVIFVQPQFSKKAAQSIADAIGGAVVPIDPLSQDYENNMRNIAQQINKALK